jgi:DNA-binding transcriptional LysR family regulator
MNMRLTHIRKTDLNLLPALAVLLEERSISRAATRHNLSQPAMSRLLQRLRGTFADELLVRTPKGYELTSRARQLQNELPIVLKDLDGLLHGEAFEPSKMDYRVRLCCSDYMSLAFTPPLVNKMSKLAPGSELEVVSWHEHAFDDVNRGRIDVLLWAHHRPAALNTEQILETEEVCVLSANHPIPKGRLTLAQYLAYPHVRVAVLQGQMTMVEDQLTAAGHKRRVGIQVPYFDTAVMAVQDTTMIATVPRLAAEQYAHGARVRIEPPPFKFMPIRILMRWHPSTDGDAALKWFRDLVRGVAHELASPAPKGRSRNG